MISLYRVHFPKLQENILTYYLINFIPLNKLSMALTMASSRLWNQLHAFSTISLFKLVNAAVTIVSNSSFRLHRVLLVSRTTSLHTIWRGMWWDVRGDVTEIFWRACVPWCRVLLPDIVSSSGHPHDPGAQLTPDIWCWSSCWVWVNVARWIGALRHHRKWPAQTPFCRFDDWFSSIPVHLARTERDNNCFVWFPSDWRRIFSHLGKTKTYSDWKWCLSLFKSFATWRFLLILMPWTFLILYEKYLMSSYSICYDTYLCGNGLFFLNMYDSTWHSVK